MPETLKSFIWVLGLGIIGVLLAIVGYLIKDKLDCIMKEMKDFRNDVVELFREMKTLVEFKAEIKGDVKLITGLCEQRHKDLEDKIEKQEIQINHLQKRRIEDKGEK